MLEEDGAFARMLIDQRIVSRHTSTNARLQKRLHEAGCCPLPRVWANCSCGRDSCCRAQADLAPTRRMPATRTAPSPPPPLAPGRPSPTPCGARSSIPRERFGRYVRVSLLGQGGAGEVWKSWDTVLERWVALKFLKFEDTEELARLKREAQTAARLSHPNIAAVFEITEANDRTFLVMEFIDGQTLATYPRNDHRKLVSLMREVAQAIQYAHDQGVDPPRHQARQHHGRLRPAGPSSWTSAWPATSTPTAPQGDYILGTPSYMSPEQARASDDRRPQRRLLARRDALRTPVGPPAVPRQQRARHARTGGPRGAAPLDRIAADLQTIVFKCLMKEPARRYARAADVAEDIRRWQEGEAIIAHPPSCSTA